jgi:hypothetical protein
MLSAEVKIPVDCAAAVEVMLNTNKSGRKPFTKGIRIRLLVDFNSSLLNGRCHPIRFAVYKR